MKQRSKSEKKNEQNISNLCDNFKQTHTRNLSPQSGG